MSCVNHFLMAEENLPIKKSQIFVIDSFCKDTILRPKKTKV